MIEIADHEKQLVEASRNRVGHAAKVKGRWVSCDDVQIMYEDGNTMKSVVLVARTWDNRWNGCAVEQG